MLRERLTSAAHPLSTFSTVSSNRMGKRIVRFCRCSPLRFCLCAHYTRGPNPVALFVELEFRGDDRLYIKRILNEYPRILQDLLVYARNIRFEAPVPLDNAPRGRAKAFDFLKAYFSDSHEDEEETFRLIFHAHDATVMQTIRQAVLALVAIYDAATAAQGYEDIPDRLITHHQTIHHRKRKG